MRLLLLFIFGLALWAETPEYGYRVLKTYPHDPGAFTQGFEFRDGIFYEGTGLNGKSNVRKVDPATGKVLQSTPLDAIYFGEGITVINGQIIQLTWKAQLAFIYDKVGLKQQRSVTYPGEGWGLTNDGQQIYMSDGSAEIRVWDPKTFKEKRRITVRDGGTPIYYLNELEYVNGEIYANVWQSDRIARISPADGKVLGWIDLSGILPPQDRTPQTDVLNGIAYDAARKRLFVTGKQWPKVFEIQLVTKPSRGK